ncbi:MAG: DNA helicase RecQ [Kiritimatiellia bacterium]
METMRSDLTVEDGARVDLGAELQSVFGFSCFRPNQEEIVRALLAHRDVFAVMPTGAGKSLCYQLPAMLLPGVCLVISPLISLMKDQVDAAQAIGLKAAFLNSSQGPEEQHEVSEALRAGALDLLYVSPERFAMPTFTTLLRAVRLAFVAIDEAHCISEWGHDFRPDYLELSQIVRLFPDCPIAAFTATATHKVARDIITKLGLRNPFQLRASFNRPNLFYQVVPKTDPDRQLLAFLRSRRGEHGIVYRMTRRSVEETAEMLTANGIKALPYHAGLDDAVRAAHQEAFNRDETDVVVATIAFGMGIDKSNVRFVVHGDLPKNLESYYQETGRAGRDGDPAHCLLLFGYGDAPRITYFIDQITDHAARQHARSCLDKMVGFGSAHVCRRRQLLAYFHEQYPEENCGMCDVCAGAAEEVDATIEAQMLLSAIVRTGSRFGGNHIVDVVTGANTQKIRQFGHDQLKTYGVGREKGKRHLQSVVRSLLAQGFLRQTGDRYPVLETTALSAAVLGGGKRFRMMKPKDDVLTAGSAGDAADAMPCHAALFEALRVLRKQIAEQQGVPPFVVFSDRTLREMSARMPADATEMQCVGGVGAHKLEQYGAAFLEAIELFRLANPEVEPLLSDGYFVPVPRRASRSETLQETAALLDQGLGIDAVAAQRGLTTGTIMGHIEKLVQDGYSIDIDRVVDMQKLEPIAAVLRQQETAELKPVFEHFEGAVSYGDIRLARAWLQLRASAFDGSIQAA